MSTHSAEIAPNLVHAGPKLAMLRRTPVRFGGSWATQPNPSSTHPTPGRNVETLVRIRSTLTHVVAASGRGRRNSRADSENRATSFECKMASSAPHSDRKAESGDRAGAEETTSRTNPKPRLARSSPAFGRCAPSAWESKRLPRPTYAAAQEGLRAPVSERRRPPPQACRSWRRRRTAPTASDGSARPFGATKPCGAPPPALAAHCVAPPAAARGGLRQRRGAAL